MAGGLGGKVGVAPRLLQTVADVLDRVDLHEVVLIRATTTTDLGRKRNDGDEFVAAEQSGEYNEL